jgi:hypothetical protein
MASHRRLLAHLFKLLPQTKETPEPEPPPEPPPVAEVLFGPVVGTTAVVLLAATLLLVARHLRDTLLASHLHDSVRQGSAESVASLRREDFGTVGTSPAAASSAAHEPTPPYKICIVGSGNWGSAIARVVGLNAARHPLLHEAVRMWVYEEQIKGAKLTEIINSTHVNVKYLPNIRLPPNVVAVPDLSKAAQGAHLLVFVLPHQFLSRLCPQIIPVVASGCRAISLIKGVEFDAGAPHLISSLISSHLGGMDVAVLMGANVANEVRARSRNGGEIKWPGHSPMTITHPYGRFVACGKVSGRCPEPVSALFSARHQQVPRDEFCEAVIGCASSLRGHV